MMQELRNFSKAFLIIVAIAFVGTIFFAWGMDIAGTSSGDQKGYIAKINDEEIDPRIYTNLVQNLSDQLNQGGSVYLDWASNVEIRERAWDRMVTDILMEQHINEMGLSVSKTEMFEYLWNYPPRYLWQDPNLQTDGQFDMQKYRQLLADPNFAQYLGMVEQQERPQIKRLQWAELVRAAIRITPEELMDEFRRQFEQIKVEYIYIPTQKVTEPEITLDTAEVKAYYEENKEDFKRDPVANLEYVAFNVQPTSSDTNDLSDINIWIQQASESEQDIFPIMAAVISDDSRATQTYGDIGWIQRGRYSPEIDSVAFSLDSGEVAQEPILTPAGWHILKSAGKRVNDDGVEEVHIYQIIKKIRPSGATFSTHFTRAQQFRTDVKELGFEKAVEKYALTIEESGPFQEATESAGRLGQSESASKFAFNHKVGAVSDVFMVANQDQNIYRFVVARVKERQPEQVIPFEEAYRTCERELRRKKLLQRAEELAMKIYDEAQGMVDLRSLADKYEVEFYETDFFTRTDYNATKLASDPAFVGAAFGLSMDESISKPVYTSRGVAVITQTGRVFNPDQFETQRDNIYNTLWAQKVRLTTDQWAAEIREDAKIEDYRDVRQKWLF